MITIDELMTENPYALRPSDSLQAARNLMSEKNIRHIPITDDDGRLLGLVTQRDILMASSPDNKNHDVELSKIMIDKVSVIRTTDSVRQAAIRLQQKKYGCLPVVTDDRLVGIVTDSDYVGVAINLLEQVELAEDEIPGDDDDFDDMDIASFESDF